MIWLRVILIKVAIVGGVWFLHWFFKMFFHHVLRYALTELTSTRRGSSRSASFFSSASASSDEDVIDICSHCGRPDGPQHRCEEMDS